MKLKFCKTAICPKSQQLQSQEPNPGLLTQKSTPPPFTSVFPNCWPVRKMIFWLWVAQGSRRRQWHPTPVLLPGKFYGRGSLVGRSPWSRWESDTTEQLHFHFSLSCIREGSGNPLQCSCLESPRDGGPWWAAVYGVTQGRTWLKRLSSNAFQTLLLSVRGAPFLLRDSCPQ